MPKVEGYMFEDHDLVRAAATECMCNLILSPEVRLGFTIEPNKSGVQFSSAVSFFCISFLAFMLKCVVLCLIPQVQKLYLATDSDRLKLLVLYSGEDDERLRKAAAGTLAVLTGEMPEVCAQIPSTVSCFSIYWSTI